MSCVREKWIYYYYIILFRYYILQNIFSGWLMTICYWTMLVFMFQDFVTGLSILSRGSIDEKLRWTFSLYDINGDGCITREEMTDIVTAVYELMGKFADPNLDREGVREKVDRMFQVEKWKQIFATFVLKLKNFQHSIYYK